MLARAALNVESPSVQWRRAIVGDLIPCGGPRPEARSCLGPANGPVTRVSFPRRAEEAENERARYGASNGSGLRTAKSAECSSVSGVALQATPVPAEDVAGTPFANRFLLVTVAFRRVVQVREGARPRVHVASQKPTVLAVAEVLAGCVPFSTDEPESADDGRS